MLLLGHKVTNYIFKRSHAQWLFRQEQEVTEISILWVLFFVAWVTKSGGII